MLKLKFTRNSATLDITNNSQDTLICKPEETLGILDFRSLVYYKIKYGLLQQNLSKYYRYFIQTLKQVHKYLKERKRTRGNTRKVSMVRS